jgi:hypothetical protein
MGIFHDLLRGRHPPVTSSTVKYIVTMRGITSGKSETKLIEVPPGEDEWKIAERVAANHDAVAVHVKRSEDD